MLPHKEASIKKCRYAVFPNLERPNSQHDAKQHIGTSELGFPIHSI